MNWYNSLILKKLLLLKFSSFCHNDGLARLCSPSAQTCPQSYPQILCVKALNRIAGRIQAQALNPNNARRIQWDIIQHQYLSGDLALFSIIQAAGWPIWPLVACSIVALALIIERFSSLKTSKVAPPKLLGEATIVSSTSIPPPDVVAKLEQNSLLGEVLASGLHALSANPSLSEADLRSTFEGAGRQAAHKMERYLAALATIASAAPLLGLLGTVIGMIEIFGSQGGSTSHGAGGNPAQLAQGISMALYNTAFGLIVAIPALIFWRYFRARVDGYLLTMELASEQFVRHLNSLRK